MGKIIAVEESNVDGVEQHGEQRITDIPPIEELQKLIEQKKNETLQQFGAELHALLDRYNVQLIPRIAVNGGQIIESAIIAEIK